MLYEAKNLKGYKLNSRDGLIGEVKDFYFDDRHWTVRYLVAETGNWLTGQQVLISPYALRSVDHERKEIDVDLTKKQIEGSPRLDSEMPIASEFENAYYGYYGLPIYWGGPFSWGPYYYPMRDKARWGHFTLGGEAWDPDLHSTRDVIGRHIQATDGEIGHMEDFIIDSDTWHIHYLIADTRNWWEGKKVMISLDWIDPVSWSVSEVFVNLSREAIKHSPEFIYNSVIDRAYETNLHDHYDRPGYWIDELAAK